MQAETGHFGDTRPELRPATGADTLIYHVKVPKFPQFRFEWHPSHNAVYMIRVGQTPEIGVVIAENTEDHGRAQMAVLVWLRGYREAKAELDVKKG